MTQLDKNSKTNEELSLENCDKEAVHIPGHIQGFAALIAADPKLKTITHCSANARETFGEAPEDILGQPISSLFDSDFIHDLNNTLCLSSAKRQRERVCEYSNENGTFEVWAHLSDDVPIIEFEKIHEDAKNQSQSILVVRSLLTRLQQIDNLQKTLDDTAVGLCRRCLCRCFHKAQKPRL